MAFKRVKPELVGKTVREALTYFPNLAIPVKPNERVLADPDPHLPEWKSKAACKGTKMAKEVVNEEIYFNPRYKLKINKETSEYELKPTSTAQQRYCATCLVAKECAVVAVLDSAPSSSGLSALYSKRSGSVKGQLDLFIKAVGGKKVINAIFTTALDDPRRADFIAMTGVAVSAILDQPSDPVSYVQEVMAPPPAPETPPEAATEPPAEQQIQV